MSAELQPPEAEGTNVRPRLLWPMVALLVLFFVWLQVQYIFEMSPFNRFMARLIPTALLLLSFLIWWLRDRRYSWAVRGLVIALTLGLLAAADAVSDPTVNFVNLVLDGLPFVFAAGLAVLFILSGHSTRSQVFAYAATTAAVFGAMTLIRWDGLDGQQVGSYSWRWTPTAETRFLTERQQGDSAPGPSAEAREIALQPGDWAGFRGGEREGSVLADPLGDWTAVPPRLLWKHRVGPAWSSMSVIDGMVITQEQRAQEECVVAYDAVTGREVWVSAHTIRFEDALSGAGPRSSPAFCEGRIYAYGGRGYVSCLNAATGETVWAHDVLTEMGGKTPQFGAAASPLVMGHLIVVFVGGTEDRGVVAFDASSGKEVWRSPGGTETYCTPQIVTLGGLRQIVMHDNSGLYGLNGDDGKRLWFHPSTSALAIPMLQPHVLPDGDLVIEWNDGVARFAVTRSGDTWTVTEKWFSNRLKAGFNEFVIHDGHIYGLDDGIFCCLDAETGKRLWKKGRYGAGQLLLLPEQRRIIVQCENGDLALVEVDSRELREIARIPAIAGKTWNHPVLAHGRLYVRNAEEMACFELSPQPSGP